MTSADFHNHNIVIDTIKSCDIEIFGFCNFVDILPLLPCRAVARIPLNAKSIIMCAFPYLVKDVHGVKNISYYACVKDYHIVVLNMLKNLSSKLKSLFPEFAFEPFTDNSPIREVKASQLSGLGCVGNNGLLITEKYGSFVFLGEVVTDMSLITTSFDKRCIQCGLCEKSCPTNSIQSVTINEDTCLSANTQKKGELPNDIQSLMIEHHTAWGCDICQLSCPMNRNAQQTYISDFLNSANHHLTVDNISKEGAYYWRGKKTIVRNLDIVNGSLNDNDSKNPQ